MQPMSGRLTSALEMENKSRSGLDTGTLGRNTLGMGSRSNSKRESSTYVYNTDVLLGTDDGLTAEFRHRIGLLPVCASVTSFAYRPKQSLFLTD